MAVINGSTSSQYWDYRVVATEISRDAASNRTKIRFDTQITRIGNASWIAGSGNVNLTVNDKKDNTNTTYSSGTISYNINPVNVGVWHTIWSKEVYVDHADDGTKTCVISSSWSNNVSPSSGSASGSFSVTTIPRYPSLSLSVATSSLTGLSILVRSDSALSQIRYKIGNGGWTTKSLSSAKEYTINFTSLQPGVSYTITVEGTRKDSGLAKSQTITAVTKPPAVVSGDISFVIGEPLTIGFSNPGNGTINVSLKVGEGDWITRNTVSNPCIFEFTDEEIDTMYAACPETNTPVVTVKVDTYHETTYLASTEKSGTATVVGSAPVFTDFTVTDENPVTVALTGDHSKFIKGYSTAHINISSAQGVHHATIVKYIYSVEGQSFETEGLSGEIYEISGKNVTVTAIDSRGNQTAVSKVLDWIEYFPLNQLTATAERSNGVDEETMLTLSGSGWYGNFGSTFNAVALKYRFKQTSASQYGEWISVVPDFSQDCKVSFHAPITGDLGVSGFDMEKSFNLEIVLSDTLTSLQTNAVVDRGVATMSLYQDRMEVVGDIWLNGVSVMTVSPPNQLVNASFEINQRGQESYTEQAAYSYDRWRNHSVGTVTREENTSPANTPYMLKLSIKDGTYNTFSQPFENFSVRWKGKKVSVSAWMKADRESRAKLRVGNSQIICELTADWKLYSGAFLVEEAADWFNQGFNFSLMSSAQDADRPGTVWIAAPQVVYGSFAGEYQPRTISQEWSDCQRFYIKDRFYRSAERAVTQSSTTFQARIGYPENLREKPSQVTFQYLACFGLTSSLVERGWDVMKSPNITLGASYATVTATTNGSPGWSSTSEVHAKVVCRATFDAEIYG